VEGLKDHPDLAPDRRELPAGRGEPFAADHDGALLHGLEAVDAADQRALARSRRPGAGYLALGSEGTTR